MRHAVRMIVLSLLFTGMGVVGAPGATSAPATDDAGAAAHARQQPVCGTDVHYKCVKKARPHYRRHDRVPDRFVTGRTRHRSAREATARQATSKVAGRKPIGCRASWLGLFGCIIAVKDGVEFVYGYATQERRCVRWYVEPDRTKWYYSGGGQIWQPSYCTRWRDVN